MKTITTLIILLMGTPQLALSEHHANQKHGEHAHHHGHEAKQPTLNQGAKWIMDTHTRDMFVVMSQRVDVGGDLKTMGAELNDDLQKLIQGCTMSGTAHDQLHVFLLPYMSAVNSLADTGSQESYQAVKQTLDEYQDYFE